MELGLHPHTFYSTLFHHHKRDEVFVIMSFAPGFDSRWNDVIRPAIEADLKLTANRVDYNVSGESIVHDILDGIAHARVVLADITSTRMTDLRGTQWPQRNGNVMWEVGIAHTMRLPDEVVMVRSDNDPSIFDLTQFRAFQYDPSDPVIARSVLTSLIGDRLKSVDQAKSDYIQRCADSLDPHAATFLIMQIPIDGKSVQIRPSLANASAVPRLCELGIICTDSYVLSPTDNPNQMTIDATCAITPLGKHVAELLARRMGVWDKVSTAFGKTK